MNGGAPPNAGFRPRVQATDVEIRRGGLVVIRHASFALGAGHHLLVGANGSGKSTLLRALAGVAPVSRGRIAIAGHDLVDDGVRARQRLGYAPQSADLFPYLSVGEFLRTVADLRGVDADPSVQLVRAWIHADCLRQRIGTLSAGQRRKLCLAAALCGTPPVLLLDEPETGLDADALAMLRTRLAGLVQGGATIVHARHGAPDPDAEIAGVITVEDGLVELGVT